MPCWEKLAPRRDWQADGIRVLAALVRHRGVEPAVGYRVETPDGVVAISGDTVVCEQVERLAEGADVLVHEIMRPAALEHLAVQSAQLRAILAYHADSVEVGALAARLGVPRLLLTHLIPQPRSTDDEQRFVEDVRKGGYTGEVLIGPDLTKVTLG